MSSRIPNTAFLAIRAKPFGHRAQVPLPLRGAVLETNLRPSPQTRAVGG
jgi:hypothetical protein